MKNSLHKWISTLDWSILAPVTAWLILAGTQTSINESLGNFYFLIILAALIGSVLAAVHHAEVVAHKVGEPFGTLLLAVSITVIEVALIISLMLSSGAETSAIARDTVFAAVMIIVSGIVGLCLLIGGILYKEQTFQLHGANVALTTLMAIVVLTLVLPNYTTTSPGPVYSSSQLAFIHTHTEQAGSASDSTKAAWISTGVLLVCLVAVVLLAKSLAPGIETTVALIGAPQQLVGVIIASIVLLPEGLAAVRAARNNLFQTSLNLALGSALASIGLTIPAVAILSLFTGWTLILGIDMGSTVLLLLALLVSSLSLATGRTNVLQGVTLLVIFAVYLFTTIVP
jgi:Ca2+:H+ antiporter